MRVESRADRLTGDPGAELLRKVLERSGIVSWMTARLGSLAVAGLPNRTVQVLDTEAGTLWKPSKGPA